MAGRFGNVSVFTTAWALTQVAFYIVNQPKTLRKLQEDLRTAIPDPKAPWDWPHLEELPYLGACIMEAVHLSYGMSASHIHNDENALLSYYFREQSFNPTVYLSANYTTHTVQYALLSFAKAELN